MLNRTSSWYKFRKDMNGNVSQPFSTTIQQSYKRVDSTAQILLTIFLLNFFYAIFHSKITTFPKVTKL
jgi:hypothetical protein